jgi:hypothetical protein
MEKPSASMLKVFQAATRTMGTDRLLDLRNTFAKAGEHPATIGVVDRELKRCSPRRLEGDCKLVLCPEMPKR